jgi:hypothetical protein
MSIIHEYAVTGCHVNATISVTYSSSFLENLASSELFIFSAQLVIPRTVGVSTQLWLKYGKLASQQSEYAFDDFCFNDLHWIVVLWISCRLTNMH